jgi:hypothetical protein
MRSQVLSVNQIDNCQNRVIGYLEAPNGAILAIPAILAILCGFGSVDFKQTLGRKKAARRNNKGCDIGYALAANSCEGVHSVDACTVTAFDAIAAFAAPDPDSSSQSPLVFSGPGVR